MSDLWQRVKTLVTGEPPVPRYMDYEVVVDLSNQVLELDLEEGDSWSPAVDDPLYPTLAALQAAESNSLPIVSAAMLMQKAKRFDDGLYAAVELAAQHGAGAFQGKVEMLRELLDALARGEVVENDQSAAILFGAARLGGLEPQVPLHLVLPVDEKVARFQANQERSKPISFYTWSDELRRIFRQDRMLQTHLDDVDDLMSLVETLRGLDRARELYSRYLGFVSRLTNPFVLTKPNLLPLLERLDRTELLHGDKEYRFFSPSRAHETELVKQLFANEPVPDDFELVSELIERVRDGRVSLEPRSDSGWYDIQSWALEPLLLPDRTRESERLRMGSKYRDCLEDLFKGTLALARETHIKQLEVPREIGALPTPTRYVSPSLTIEPLCTHYLRRSLGYLFVRTLLVDFFGTEALGDMRRQSGQGFNNDVNLDSELRLMAGLFRGAFEVSCDELGLSRGERDSMVEEQLEQCAIPASSMDLRGAMVDEQEGRASYERWAGGEKDPDLSEDVRAMVPVYFDRDRNMLKVWVFLGWETRTITVSFVERPKVGFLDNKGREVSENVPVEWPSSKYDVAYPVTAEIHVTRVLDRQEFRAHCDKYQQETDILESLE